MVQGNTGAPLSFVIDYEKCQKRGLAKACGELKEREDMPSVWVGMVSGKTLLIVLFIPPTHWAPTRSQTSCQVLGCNDEEAAVFKGPQSAGAEQQQKIQDFFQILSDIHCDSYPNFRDVKFWENMYFRINEIR